MWGERERERERALFTVCLQFQLFNVFVLSKGPTEMESHTRILEKRKACCYFKEPDKDPPFSSTSAWIYCDLCLPQMFK